MAHSLVTWAPRTTKPTVKVIYPNGLSSLVGVDRLAESLPRGCAVQSYYGDGPYLLSKLLAARDTGLVADIVLRPYRNSHPFQRTQIRGVHERTARLWIDRTPESVVVHPVFYRLAPYIPLGLPGALANVIVVVFDPRWYVDPRRPNRWARLEQAFALSPRGDVEGCPRRAVIRACWAADDVRPGEDDRAADFFGRRHARLLDAGVPEAVAVRKVGRQFLRAVVAAWMDAATGGDALFDPARLFDARAVSAGLQK